MRIRAYKLFTPRELEHIRSQLEKQIESWSRSWFTERNRAEICQLAGGELFLAEAVADVAAEWFVSSASEDNWVATLSSGRLDDILQNILIETSSGPNGAVHTESAFASELAARLLFDLAECLIENSPRNTGKKINHQRKKQIIAEDVWRHGTAAAYGAISIGRKKIYFVLSPDIVNDYLSSLHRPRRELVKPMPINKAIDPVKLNLEIAVGEAELSVAELRNISVGDVLRLDTRLDEPVDVLLGKKRVCSAFLGAHQGKKAVLLMSSS